MAKVIKANMVNFTDEFPQIIEVPDATEFIARIHQQESAQVNVDSTFAAYNDELDSEAAIENIDPEKIIKDAEEEAERIKQEAAKEADTIVQYGKMKAEEEKAAVREEAQKEGFEQGQNEAFQQHASLINEANETLTEAQRIKEESIANAEPQIISMVISIVEKLVSDVVKYNPSVISYIIKTGLDGVPDAKELSVRVSKEDYEMASSMKEEISSNVDSDTVVTIIKDTSLSQGDCVIDAPIGSVDCSLNTQWSSLKNDLIAIMKSQE